MLITFEGIDGAGKTTCLHYIKNIFENVVITKEPWGPMGSLALNASDPTLQTILMFASRNEHVAKYITPKLQSGHVVLCDRFIDSTYAYQHGGYGVSKQLIYELNKTINVQPCITFLCDAPVDICIERVDKRGRPKGRIEHESPVFFNRVRNAYLELADQYKERFAIINTDQCFDEIKKNLLLTFIKKTL